MKHKTAEATKHLQVSKIQPGIFQMIRQQMLGIVARNLT